jgi:DNA-binding sugar fermentation-stimulating protein
MSQMGSISSAAIGVGRRSIAAVPPEADIDRRYENVSVDLHSLGVNRVNLRVNVLTASTLFFTTPG